MIITRDWEQFDIRRKVHDLASRHTMADTGMYFRPETLNVRRSVLNGSVVIARLSGPRVHAGGVDRGVLDRIEYDITRDHFPVWLIELIRELGLTVKVRPIPVGPYEKLLEHLEQFDQYQAEQIPDGNLEADPKDGYDSWDERTAEFREYIHFEVLDLMQTLGLRKTGRETVKL